jgi:hypothetical protein
LRCLKKVTLFSSLHFTSYTGSPILFTGSCFGYFFLKDLLGAQEISSGVDALTKSVSEHLQADI